MNRRHFFKLGFAGIGTMAFSPNLWALKYYPLPSDKKWAVLYATWCGSTRDAALWISEGMGGIVEVKSRQRGLIQAGGEIEPEEG